MGVRLYPITKDTAKLEKLAGVPEGTMRKLQLWNEMQAAYRSAIGIRETDYDERNFDMWQLMHNTDVEQLDNFLGNGWGKFQLSLIPLDEDGSEEPRICGSAPVGGLALNLLISATSTDSEEDWQSIGLRSAEVLNILVEAEGVYWG
jgi:hypothetical protein